MDNFSSVLISAAFQSEVVAISLIHTAVEQRGWV